MDRPVRKALRLKGYDYSQNGAYFITICTYKSLWLFGEISNDSMCLEYAGEVAQKCWESIPDHFPNIELDAFVVMPNHIHGILLITDVGAAYMPPVQSPPSPPKKTPSLSTVINAYKAAVTRQVNTYAGISNQTIWHRSFHDHIIRNESSLNKIREYVVTNPQRWSADCYYGNKL